MKKFILTLVVGLFAMSANAQIPDFFKNVDGEYVIEGSVDGAGASDDALYAKAKIWAINFGAVNEDKAAKTMKVESGLMHLGTSVNPFAGSWTEELQYQCSIKVENSKIIYTFSSLLVKKVYAGYGVKHTQFLIGQLVDMIKEKDGKLAEIEANADLSKKDKKKQIAEVKDNAEAASNTFDKIEKALDKDVTLLKDML